MTIILINDDREVPGFSIDYARIGAQNRSTTEEKTQAAALTAFSFVELVFSSLATAAWSTTRYAWVAFKHIVLDFHGSWARFRLPSDFYLVAFKIVLWVASLFWCTTTTTLRLIFERLYPTNLSYSNEYASRELNLDHLQTNQRVLDARAVPQNVTVNDLLTIFDKINFTDPTQPGYMTEGSRTEGYKVNTSQELKDSLTHFVTCVNKRTAFVGTPPAYDTPRLMVFYQQIEDAVRLSIHASNERIKEFKKNNGDDAANYDTAQQKQYKDLLEDRARIAIDLSIAGQHCGARFMGETMSVYYQVMGDEVALEGTLQQTVFELLAKKRLEIAQKQIQKYLGTDTHQYSLYMSSLGKALALPGTENIIEHLINKFDREKYLKHFFEEYTVDCIIDTLQKAYKESQAFREKVTDWVKDQVADWKKEGGEMDSLAERVAKALERVEQKQDGDVFLLGNCLDALNTKANELPGCKDDWNAWIDELFTSEAFKKWRQSTFTSGFIDDELKANKDYSDAPPAQKAIKQRVYPIEATDRFKGYCKAVCPGRELFERMQTNKERLDYLKTHACAEASTQPIIAKVRAIVLLEPDTIKRLMKNQNEIERKEQVAQAIAAKLDLERSNEFLAAISERHIKAVTEEDPLSRELMEWLTVSLSVFHPQEVC